MEPRELVVYLHELEIPFVLQVSEHGDPPAWAFGPDVMQAAAVLLDLAAERDFSGRRSLNTPLIPDTVAVRDDVQVALQDVDYFGEYALAWITPEGKAELLHSSTVTRPEAVRRLCHELAVKIETKTYEKIFAECV